MHKNKTCLSYIKVLTALICVVTINNITLAADVPWTGGTGNWSTAGSWTGGFVPSEEFEEIAIINNGGVVTLSSSTDDAAGLILGTAEGDSGTLIVASGGSLTLVNSSGEPSGAANISLEGSGLLEVQGGGSFTTTLLDVNVLGDVVIGSGSGSATFMSTGSMFSDGTITTHGSGHTFTAATNVTLEANSSYVVNLTSGFHTTLSAVGSINLGGDLVVQATGFSPTLGDSWDLFEGNTINGSINIDTAALPTPSAGTSYSVVQADSGTNTTLLQLKLGTHATLMVNSDTGATSMVSESGSAINIIGYSVLSANGSLNSAGWNSLADQSAPGWEEATPSANALNELNATGNFSITGTETSLGSAYALPTSFGESADLQFEYLVEESGKVATGVVEYTGSSADNNLLLTIDPTTGEGQLKNSSTFVVSLLGYSILSETGSLDSAGWDSLASASTPGWDEASPTANALSELVPTGTASLNPGQEYSLGNLFTMGEDQDVVLEFLMDGETEARLGIVRYGEITVSVGLPGDYNNDGQVNAADYTVWRDNDGTNFALQNEGASPGVVDAADYAFWVSNYGNSSTSTSSATAVPEPTSLAVMLSGSLALLGGIGRRRN